MCSCVRGGMRLVACFMVFGGPGPVSMSCHAGRRRRPLDGPGAVLVQLMSSCRSAAVAAAQGSAGVPLSWLLLPPPPPALWDASARWRVSATL
jgi:hypothetical protein